MVTPCGDRFFSIGINGLDERLLVPPPRIGADKSWAASQANAHSWMHRTVRRMKAWGFNTVGGFSARGLPFPSVPHLGLGWEAKFLWADPFDPSVERRMRIAARRLVASDRRYRIGYFSDNEVGWWNGALFIFFIHKPETSYTKRKLVALLQNYYGQDWNRFTKDFVVPPVISSFRDLLCSIDKRVQLRPGGNGIKVVRLWTSIVAGRYYKFIHEALREADPQAIIFGDRLPSYYDPDAVRAMAPFVDAVATNYNVDSADGWVAHYYFDGLRRLTTNKPVLVSEWYCAARQNRSGNLNNGCMLTVETQSERADSAANAARSFALNPNVVGIHWFQYYDEPMGGRADGEDFDFGLVDTSDRAYEGLAATLGDANRSLAGIHQLATDGAVGDSTIDVDIPKAHIDARQGGLPQWPKDRALIKGLKAPRPEVPFGDFLLAWSPEGLHLATVAMDYYDKDLLAYDKVFPLEEAFRFDLGVDAGRGPRHFAFYVIPPRRFPKKGAAMFRIQVCRMDHGTCTAVPSAVVGYFPSYQLRINTQVTLPWEVIGSSGPPRDRRLRVELAATAFHRSRWMSLSGAPPDKAMEDSASWRPARLIGPR